MRSIKKIHSARYAPIADLKTYSPLPSDTLPLLDPFLFLNHHGPQTYPPHNQGLPFGPHPHRGMETVTIILDGDIMHKDSGGHESIITAGGVQWMTAGRGLIHAEVSSPHFKKEGGKLEILQLWLNLPAKRKMADPFYKGLQKEDIPTLQLQGGSVQLQLIAGQWDGTEGAFQPQTDVFLSTITFAKGGSLSLSVAPERTLFFYLIRGVLRVQDRPVHALQLVEFEPDGDQLHLQAEADSVLLFGHAAPFGEPVVARGPFVMNSEQEIYQAYQDYQQGKFGRWT